MLPKEEVENEKNAESAFDIRLFVCVGCQEQEWIRRVSDFDQKPTKLYKSMMGQNMVHISV